MKDINFLSKGSAGSADLTGRGKNSSTVVLVIILLIVIAVGGKLILVQQNHRLQSSIDEKEAYIEANKIIYKVENDIKDYNVQFNKTKDIISRLQKVSVKNSEVFEQLGKGIPNKVYMATYVFTDDRKVAVTGMSPTKEEVAQYTWSLKQLNVFKDVLLNSVKREVNGDNTGESYKYDFTVEL